MVATGLFQKNSAVIALTCLLGFMLSACGGGGGDSAAPATAAASGGTSTATGTNQAPTITGTPVTTATVGTAYSFSPVGADANGDTLTYSYTGALPTGLTLNTATGVVSGTPTVVGTYAGITIKVTDTSSATASLAAFSITVSSGGATASVVLTWTQPVLNTDGSALNDLTGYKVYYGTSAADLTGSVSVPATALTATIPALPVGTTYYFAIASISASGGEGNKSNVASKII